jgi:ribonuclease P protein component
LPPADARFAPDARLRRPGDYSRVFANPRKSADALFTVLARPRPVGGARLGLAISKKNLRRAVDRSRIKRLVRESFRRHRSGLGGLDVVVLARRGVSEHSNTEIFASLDRHWRRLARTSGPRMTPGAQGCR